MNRYTLSFRTTGEMDPATLRLAVEDALQPLHPRFTYRMGIAARKDPQTITVEIASEASQETLAPQWKLVERKLPVSLERISWGWDSGDSSLASRQIQNPDVPADPFASVAAPAGPAVFLSKSHTPVLRCLLFGFLTVALGVALYEKFHNSASPEWDILLFLAYLPWFFSLGEIQFNPFRLARRIDCGDGGIEVQYWIGGKTTRADWKDVWGLDFTRSNCVLRTSGAPIHFSLSNNSGFEKEKVLLKTIVERAELRFVKGQFWSPFYRRADAA
jgi:hypothetical protein